MILLGTLDLPQIQYALAALVRFLFGAAVLYYALYDGGETRLAWRHWNYLALSLSVPNGYVLFWYALNATDYPAARALSADLLPWLVLFATYQNLVLAILLFNGLLNRLFLKVLTGRLFLRVRTWLKSSTSSVR